MTMKFLKSIVTILVAIYIVATGYLYFFQDGMIFPAPDDQIGIEADENFVQIGVQTPDGEKLFALHHPSQKNEATIIVFHGNGDAAIHQKSRGLKLIKAGFGVLLAEYRGYPGSTGTASEVGLFTDALAFYDYIIEQRPQKIGLYGHSLGSGVSTYLASERDVFALVLEGPFDALAAVAADRYPLIPVWQLIKHKFQSDIYIKDLDAKILIMHGDLDTTVPIKHGRRLLEAAPKGTNFVEIIGGRHSDLEKFGSEEKAVDFFKQALN